jgi:hypothetical protein
MQLAHWNLAPQHLNTCPGVMTAGSGRVRMSAMASASESSLSALHWHMIIRRRPPSLLVENETTAAGFAQRVDGTIVLDADFT